MKGDSVKNTMAQQARIFSRIAPLVSAILLATAGMAQNLIIDASSVSNAGSNIAPNYPNGGVSHGGMFIVKAAAGSGPFGACGVKLADKFPIATSMNGTTMKITMGASSFDVPMIYVVACAGTDQLAGIVPSNVPVGVGTLTIAYNGQSGSAPITIVDRTLGFFTLNQGGTGVAIVQNFNSATDLVVNTLATPAKPGQYGILWGTGLGPDGHSDVDAPQPTDIPVNLELFVGGKLAAVAYKGRSGCCSGIDQIVFLVPDGLDGCYVPVVAKIGNAVSNFTTMSVSVSGGVCSDATGLTAADIQSAQRNNKIRLGMVDLFRADIELVTGANTGFVTRLDQASAVFSDLTFGDLIGMPVREISTPGSCTVWRGSAIDSILNRPPILAPHINLDAGTISVQGAAGSGAMNYRGDFYSALLGGASSAEPPSGPGPTLGFLEPGSFTVTSPGGGPIPGGKLIGAFNTQITVPLPPKFDNRFAVGTVQRSQGVTVNWSGVDAAALVEIRGVSAPADPALPSVTFFCVEKASAGQFTVPPSVLLSLPPAGSYTEATGRALGLSVGVTGVVRFTAPGVDAGLLRFNSLFGRSVTFQ
jgi:uncharacterized protein (TIGR03437 family)